MQVKSIAECLARGLSKHSGVIRVPTAFPVCQSLEEAL